MNRLIVLGVVLLGAIYLFFSSIFVVNEREQAIVMRFGQITQVIKDPGIHFKIPTNLIDSVQIIEDRLLRYDLANMTVQVSGGKFYEVDAFLTYKIADPRLFRERALGELRTVESRLATRFDAALRQVYGLREFNAALSDERPQMMKEARDLIRPDMAELGIDVVDVRILRTDLTSQVSAQTYDRMKAERLAEAALVRARGQEQAQSLKAIADRQKVEILASAQRDSEILRGEGDAERNKIFAQAYSADPNFFEFYRTMESYRTALANGDTTLVLAPDSEFFKYFNDALGGANSLPAPGQAQPVPQPSIVPETSVPDTLFDPGAEPLPDATQPLDQPESLAPAEDTPLPTVPETDLPPVEDPTVEQPAATP